MGKDEIKFSFHRIGCVMVSVLASSAVDRVFEPRSGQTKDYDIGICYFSAKHAVLSRTRKDWLTRNQDNVSADCCFSELALNKIQLSVLV